MTVELNYWDILDRTKPRSEIIRQVEIQSETEIEIFEEFYKKNNSLRYCNGSHYTFVSDEWKNKYDNWLKSDDYKSKSFDLFYGKNGIVD